MIKNEKPPISPQNEDDKCFQYAATIALNYKGTDSNPVRVSYIKPFVNKYNWEGINHPSKLDDWKRFQELNNCS